MMRLGSPRGGRFQVRPVANGVVNRFGGPASGLPRQGHELQTLLLAFSQCLLKLPIVCLRCRHACLARCNINVFFLQRVSHGDVESCRREACTVMSPGFFLEPVIWFFFSITTAESPAALAL